MSKANGMFPTWSPDHERLAFLAMQGKNLYSDPDRPGIQSAGLMVVSSDGGEAKQLAELRIPYLDPQTNFRAENGFFFWSPDGSRLAYLNYLYHDDSSHKPVRFEIYVVPVSGDGPLKIGETTFAWDDAAFQVRPLAWSPDSTKLAFTSYGANDYGVYIASADGSEIGRITTLRYASMPHWNPEGNRLLFQLSAFLPHSQWLIEGEWVPSTTYSGGRLMQIDVDGNYLKVLADYVSEPTFSPDGSMVAYVDGSSVEVMSLTDRSRSVIAQVCGMSDEGYRLRWSPDSQLIAFRTGKVLQGGRACELSFQNPIVVYSLQGELIYQTKANWTGPFGFSPDSRFFISNDPEWGFQIIDLRDGSMVYRVELDPLRSVAW